MTEDEKTGENLYLHEWSNILKMTSGGDLYFVAIVPPSEIKEEVLEMKLGLKEKFRLTHALKLPGHITLVPPVRLKMEQKKLFLHGLEKVVQKHSRFHVELENFGHFRKRVVFIKVVDNIPLQLLYRDLLENLAEYLPQDMSRSFHPHVTLASRDLTSRKFPEVWEELKNRKYHNSFQAAALTLFRHNGKSWDIFYDFSLDQNDAL